MEGEERAIAIIFLIFAAIAFAIAVLMLGQRTMPVQGKSTGKGGKKPGGRFRARQSSIVFLFIGLILTMMGLSLLTGKLFFRIAEIVLIVGGVFFAGRSSGFFGGKK